MRTALIFANTGTALMFTQGMHLLYGNAIIGLIEGVLIGVVFKGRMGRAIPIMILANYISMAAGITLQGFIAQHVPSDWAAHQQILHHARLLQIALVIGAFALTILIEWPFCRWIMRKLPRANKKAWRANILAQVVSYGLLVPLYFGASQTSLATEFTLQESVAFARPPIATVYYINPDDGDVWRIQTDGTGQERALEADLPARGGALAFVLAEDGQSWDLYFLDRPPPYNKTAERLSAAFAMGRACDGSTVSETGRDFFLLRDAPDLRAEADRPWFIRLDFWGGFFVRDEDDWSNKLHVAFEIPGIRMRAQSPTILSSGQVIFELDGTIMLLDPKTRDLGLLTKGRGPAVIEPGETFNTWVDPMTPKRSPTTKPASPDETGISSRPMPEFPTTAPAEGEPAAGE